MFMVTMKFNRKTAVFIVVMAALVLIGIVLLAGARDAARARGDSSVKSSADVGSDEGRAAYLAQYGWKAELPALSSDTVVIPRTFSEVFDNYNDLQKQQGFDLSRYCGLEVELYTYKITGSDLGGNAVASLYIYDDAVVGGDVHSTELDGEMRGIK